MAYRRTAAYALAALYSLQAESCEARDRTSRPRAGGRAGPPAGACIYASLTAAPKTESPARQPSAPRLDYVPTSATVARQSAAVRAVGGPRFGLVWCQHYFGVVERGCAGSTSHLSPCMLHREHKRRCCQQVRDGRFLHAGVCVAGMLRNTRRQRLQSVHSRRLGVAWPGPRARPTRTLERRPARPCCPVETKSPQCARGPTCALSCRQPPQEWPQSLTQLGCTAKAQSRPCGQRAARCGASDVTRPRYPLCRRRQLRSRPAHPPDLTTQLHRR